MLKNQACSSSITSVNSSTSAGYDSYVDGSSSIGPDVLAIGCQCNPSRKVKCSSMFSTLQNHKNMDRDLPFIDFTNHFRCSKNVHSALFAGSALNNLLIFLDVSCLLW